MKILHMVSYVLLWIGGLNWGLLGFFNYNLVESLFSANTSNLIYMFVGLAAVYTMFTHAGECKVCSKK